MCLGPVAGLIGTAVSAALSIAQMGVSQQRYNEQKANQRAAHERNRLAAIQAANDRYASVAAKSVDEDEKAHQKKFEKQIELKKKKATAQVSAAEAGVTGLSVAQLLGDFENQQARAMNAIETNRENVQTGLADELDVTYNKAIQRIYSVRPA